MNHIVSNIRAAIIERNLVVGACHDKIKRAERLAKKDGQPVPRGEMDRLQNELRDARLNVYSAECSLAGASKYPPLT